MQMYVAFFLGEQETLCREKVKMAAVLHLFRDLFIYGMVVTNSNTVIE